MKKEETIYRNCFEIGANLRLLLTLQNDAVLCVMICF